MKVTKKAHFWQQLRDTKAPQSEPIFVLAPMANVTDVAFRRIIAKYSRMGKTGGGPDVLWTEFVSADGLMLANTEGRAKLMKDLEFSKGEHPIVAQFFTSTPAHMEKAAALAAKLGFDGVDINMGCPDRSIERQGAGAAMIKTPKIAREIIRAAKKGASASAGRSGMPLPVSVKTRIGYNRKEEMIPWLTALLEERPSVITIHARTRKEMSAVPARWEHIRDAVALRDTLQADLPPSERTLIFGNGDVLDLASARSKAAESGADGVMLGRAIFGNPWLFDQKRAVTAGAPEIPLEEKLAVLLEHTKLFEKLLGDTKSFAIMKKHFKAYVNGFDGAHDLRAELMLAEDAKGVAATIKRFFKTRG